MRIDDDLEITEEVAENALDALAGGLQPGVQISRQLRLPVKYPLSDIEFVARYSSGEALCLTSTGVRSEGDPVSIDDPEMLLQVVRVELVGAVPEDLEPGHYQCTEVEVRYPGFGFRVYSEIDLLNAVPSDFLDSVEWPREIVVDWT